MRRQHLLRLITTTMLAAATAVSVQAVAAQPAGAAAASVPRPDHIVIVVEENRSDANIMGNPDAPYINSLAASGANFTQSFAETHPSQPNYIALFSGSTQGVTDDSCPHTFTAPNLGSELLDAGLGFAGYSESLPSVGYTGCTSGKYARKHAPWTNFSDVPGSASQPFTAFPSDYSTLPEVSFVIPNLDNDMHDGTIAQGDQWLQDNLAGYITWAQTHNSVFLLTFDEDEGGGPNQIPTVVTGQPVMSGDYSETINHYNVMRTIQDAYGLAPIGASATAPPILDIWTPPTGDQSPVAAFTSSCAGLACTFDGSGSSDPDGTVQSYLWNFGDGGSSTNPSPAHTYASMGTYPVRLTVTDDQDASSSITHQVSVVAPPGTPFVSDSFDRTVTGGFGTADVGGDWSRAGSASAFSVADGTASLRMPSAPSRWEAFVGSEHTDTDLAFTFRADKAPAVGPIYLTATARRVSSNTTYRAVVMIYGSGWTTIRLTRLVSGSETTIAGPFHLAGFSYTSGTALRVRVQATGTNPTALRARAWPVASGEPADWQVTASDSTPALQSGGAVGFNVFLGAVTNAPITLGFSSFVAAPTAALPPPGNSPPVAAFTSSCAGLSCTFDASGSSDLDGSIASYSWDFGDGTFATGKSASHTYGSAATFTVGLTVVDGAGASDSVNHQLTTTGSQLPIAFVLAVHGPGGATRTESVQVPAAAQVGDTMLLFLTNSDAATWAGPVGVTGWTQLSTFSQASIVSTLWQKTVASGDPGTVVRLTSATYSKAALTLAVYRGVGTAAPVLAHAEDSGAASHITPSVTAPAGSWVVSLWADKSANTTSWSAPAGVTTRDTLLGTGGGRYGALLVDSGGPVSGGSYGGLTATTNAASWHAVAWTVALVPSG